MTINDLIRGLHGTDDDQWINTNDMRVRLPKSRSQGKSVAIEWDFAAIGKLGDDLTLFAEHQEEIHEFLREKYPEKYI